MSLAVNGLKYILSTDSGFPRKPRFVVYPVNTNSTLGGTVVLECAANGSPRPPIKWFKDGVRLVLGGTKSLVGETNLFISSVSLSDAGVYMCQAGEVRLEKAVATLQVHCELYLLFPEWEVHVGNSKV